MSVRVGFKNPSLAITDCHPSASLVMPIGDPQDDFLYPTLILMIDTFSIIPSVHAEIPLWKYPSSHSQNPSLHTGTSAVQSSFCVQLVPVTGTILYRINI